MTAPRHVDVGAYVLGILDPPDEAAYEEHFAQCEQCRREFIELADMPAVLDTLKPGRPETAPPPLSALIDFSKLGPAAPPSQPPPAVPPQQRPNGATQPHRIPGPQLNGASRANGTAHPHTNDTTRANSAAHPHTNDATRPNSAARPHANGAPRPLPAPPGNPAPRGAGVQRSSPALTPAPRPTPAKPPSKPRDPGPGGRAGGRRSRKPAWLTAAAAVLVALTVGVVVALPSADSGGQVADRGTSAPPTPPSGAVAGAHVVSGTDPETGVTAIITIEPVTDGTEVDLTLYEIDGPQDGTLIAVSRFGERAEVAAFRIPEGRAESITASGVAPFGQGDISRFEVYGDGIEPLLEVST